MLRKTVAQVNFCHAPLVRAPDMLDADNRLFALAREGERQPSMLVAITVTIVTLAITIVGKCSRGSSSTRSPGRNRVQHRSVRRGYPPADRRRRRVLARVSVPLGLAGVLEQAFIPDAGI